MSVEVNTYRFRNTMYGAQGYFAIKETITGDLNDVIYSGYKNAFSPLQIFTQSEISSTNLHGDGSSYTIIPGDKNGFTDSNTTYNWRRFYQLHDRLFHMDNRVPVIITFFFFCMD